MWLVTMGDINELCNISFREVQPNDFQIIKLIHMQLFPIQYSDEFLSNATKGIGLNGRPLSSCIATSPDAENDIVGFIFYQFIERDSCEESDILDPRSPATQTCYILTLGLLPQYRRGGLGGKLLKKCIDFATACTECGMVISS